MTPHEHNPFWMNIIAAYVLPALHKLRITHVVFYTSRALIFIFRPKVRHMSKIINCQDGSSASNICTKYKNYFDLKELLTLVTLCENRGNQHAALNEMVNRKLKIGNNDSELSVTDIGDILRFLQGDEECRTVFRRLIKYITKDPNITIVTLGIQTRRLCPGSKEWKLVARALLKRIIEEKEVLDKKTISRLMNNMYQPERNVPNIPLDIQKSVSELIVFSRDCHDLGFNSRHANKLLVIAEKFPDLADQCHRIIKEDGLVETEMTSSGYPKRNRKSRELDI